MHMRAVFKKYYTHGFIISCRTGAFRGLFYRDGSESFY